MPSPDQSGPVTILGAGIVGICTALSLLERGRRVRIIDKGAPGQATSMGNAGVISPWSIIPQAAPGTWKQIPKLMFGYGRPLSIKPGALPQMIPWGVRFLRNCTEAKLRQTADAMEHLCGPSVDLYRRHLQGTGREDLITDSFYVHAFRNEARADIKTLEYTIRTRKGAECEVVGRDTLAHLEPALSPDFKAAIVIKGQARARSPGRLAEVLAEKAVAQGAVFISDEIKSLRRTDTGWQITCAKQTHQSEEVIIAMGAWSAKLLEPLGVKVPLIAERGYHIECADPGVELNNSVMDVDAKVVASTMLGGLRVAGQAEFAPIDSPPTPHRADQLKKVAQALLPDLHTAKTRVWMGARPSFPDSLPALGALQGQDGLFLNFGHSHYGLMMAPKSGDLLADQISARSSNLDMHVYSASRF